MLLAIDIGNTNITFGIFKKDRLIKKFDIPSRDYALNRLKAELGAIKPDSSVICSVVPRLTKTLKDDLTKALGRQPYIIGKQIRVPIKNLYRRPDQVGQDRLINAFAGIMLYGAPLIIVDFGTAITFDVVSKNKEYLGGMILPGLSLSLDALNRATALLPKIKLTSPQEFIAKTTRNSMLSGIIYGFAGLTDSLIAGIKNKIGRDALVIATGGSASLLKKYCRSINKTDGVLILKGLAMIYKKVLKNS
jgi:type III pantothenate kinase